jgi:hypothetical protein
MTVITKVLGVFKGRTAKLAGAVAATLLLAPIPALGFTFLTSWTFNSLTVNAPTPATTVSDFTGGTQLSIDMGKNGITTQAGLVGSAVNPGAISFFTAQRDISVGGTGENVNVARSYATLLQGASLQTIVYFTQTSGANTGTRVNITPNIVNAAGIRFARTFPGGADIPDSNVNLGPGTYTIFVRIKYKKDRFGIWDNSSPLPGSPHTFTFTGP